MKRSEKIKVIDSICYDIYCEECPYLYRKCFTDEMTDEEIDEMFELMIVVKGEE